MLAIIFDLDNTIIDTYGVYWNAKFYLAKAIKNSGGKTGDLKDFVEIIFGIDRELCAKYKRWNYDQQILIEQSCKKAGAVKCDFRNLTKEYEKNLEKTPELLPGAFKTLSILKSNSICLLLLSEGIQAKVEKILQKLNIATKFDQVIVLQRKDETNLCKVMDALKGKGYCRIFYVGDSIDKDIKIGNAIGCTTIWLPSRWEIGKPTKEETKPHYTIKCLEEILNIVKTKNV